jgi:hypothetical protein
MKKQLVQAYKRLKDDDNLERIEETMTVLAVHGADGIAVGEFKTNKVNTLPPKVFVTGLRILRINITVNNTEKLLYRNQLPNSPNQVPCSNVIMDESEDHALRTVYLKISPFLDKLNRYIMHVSDMKFSFQIENQSDGKLRCRELGMAGATHTYNCNLCESRKTDISISGKVRTIQSMKQMSTRAQWNPLNKATIILYHESKGNSSCIVQFKFQNLGCEKVAISPHEPDRMVVDELHVMLNIHAHFEKGKLLIHQQIDLIKKFQGF